MSGLRKLRITGFAKLRSGCIHMRCPACGRKQSNATRFSDPPNAVLLECLCTECASGMQDDDVRHFDRSGKEIS